jgi:leader peptidase (prepilin peptidase)/N-methyltransferase
MTGREVVLAAAVVGAVAGVGAGAAARQLLARMRRGARVRAPVCEVAVGLMWAGSGGLWAAGALRGSWLPVLLGLGWMGVAVAAVDLRHHRIPDGLTLPAVPAAFALLSPLGPGALARAAAGAVVAVAAHAALHLVAPRAMGAGDVKLAASLGAVLTASSWAALLLAAGLSALITGLAAVVLLAAGRVGCGGAVPHGPSMLVAGWVVVVGAAAGAGGG